MSDRKKGRQIRDVFEKLRANHSRKDGTKKKMRGVPTSDTTKLRKRNEIYERAELLSNGHFGGQIIIFIHFPNQKQSTTYGKAFGKVAQTFLDNNSHFKDMFYNTCNAAEQGVDGGDSEDLISNQQAIYIPDGVVVEWNEEITSADGGEFEDPNINKQAVSDDVLEEMNEEIATVDFEVLQQDEDNNSSALDRSLESHLNNSNVGAINNTQEVGLAFTAKSTTSVSLPQQPDNTTSTTTTTPTFSVNHSSTNPPTNCATSVPVESVEPTVPFSFSSTPVPFTITVTSLLPNGKLSGFVNPQFTGGIDPLNGTVASSSGNVPADSLSDVVAHQQQQKIVAPLTTSRQPRIITPAKVHPTLSSTTIMELPTTCEASLPLGSTHSTVSSSVSSTHLPFITTIHSLLPNGNPSPDGFVNNQQFTGGAIDQQSDAGDLSSGNVTTDSLSDVVAHQQQQTIIVPVASLATSHQPTMTIPAKVNATVASTTVLRPGSQVVQQHQQAILINEAGSLPAGVQVVYLNGLEPQNIQDILNIAALTHRTIAAPKRHTTTQTLSSTPPPLAPTPLPEVSPRGVRTSERARKATFAPLAIPPCTPPPVAPPPFQNSTQRKRMKSAEGGTNRASREKET